jgi:hypothetical protein
MQHGGGDAKLGTTPVAALTPPECDMGAPVLGSKTVLLICIYTENGAFQAPRLVMLYS